MSSSTTSQDVRPAGPFVGNDPLVSALRRIVGARHVLTGAGATARYRSGFRFGSGSVLAVVRPGTLVEQWRTVAACVEANVIVITQASNTGLTGGSTPSGDDYDRDVVIVSTTRIDAIHLIDGGRQAICTGGATLYQLEGLLKPLQREPHSVIGSSCIGASVIGGICNNSGGALVQRGPAYTELALFAAVNADGELALVNHLGISLGDTPEEILERVERGDFDSMDVRYDAGRASDDNYGIHVRAVNEPTPARFNADPARLFEASGCAGKLMVFAVRVDTFPAAPDSKVFYIGSNDIGALTDVRRHVLTHIAELPIAGEYVHRDAFDMAERYGKDMFLIIEYLGTRWLPAFFRMKTRFDTVCRRLKILPENLSDRLLQFISGFFPDHLPGRIKAYRDLYAHHLLLKVSSQAAEEVRVFLEQYFSRTEGAHFECAADEARKAFLHRFAVASAAIRYRNLNSSRVEDIVALDIALRRNDSDWFESLPDEINEVIVERLYYGHFMCHVFHQDYIVRKGTDCIDLEHRMLKILDERGARYPAEHNVGHLYEAGADLKAFYRHLDPCNCFNPGIGRMSKFSAYRDDHGE